MRNNPIFAALDMSDPAAALKLVELLAPWVGGFKVGSELFTVAGPDWVRALCARGVTVFLDLKFHDIPHTVARAVAAASGLGVQFLTVHTSGGRAMLVAAERSAREAAQAAGHPAPVVLGVTVLTSLEDADLREIGCPADAQEQVGRLADLALQAGLQGLVCSPREVAWLRKRVPAEMKLAVPGIRLKTDAVDDQKRTLTPRETLEAGADWLVIGRPICSARDPAAAAARILASLS